MQRNFFWRHWRTFVVIALVLIGGWLVFSWVFPADTSWRAECGTKSGHILDEALCAYKNDPDVKAASGGSETDAEKAAKRLHVADDDYYRDMDNGATKNPVQLAKDLDPYVPGISPEEALKATVIGRNNWIVWTAGNDRFWDVLSKKSFGNLDLLKTISNAPNLKYSRDNRWEYLGLVNEPCFKKPSGSRLDRFGLYLDERDPACGPDPFEDETKYPGVKIGARGSKTLPVGSLYGYGTGIVGLRLFPNPDFDEKAQAKWDWFRYYNDPSYYNDKDLVKPYRVGMSCGFCHVGPSPTNPPKDANNPKWENLNSNPGAQYYWVDRIFTYEADASNYVFQLFHTSRPGALDTSLVSSDYINNPRTMNAIYNLGARLDAALKFGKEHLAGSERLNKQFNEYVGATSPLNKFYQAPDTVWTPRVLKDGSDSVGSLGALNRVYVNIGLFGDEWITHFNPIVGGTGISPIEIAVGRKNSAYWVSNESQTPNLALFFLATAKPDYLNAAPGGDQYLTKDAASLENGRHVFAENCAACHSSKLPEKSYSFFPDDGCNNANYFECWNNYWSYSRSDEFKTKMTEIVDRSDFLKDNFLSTDIRVPSTLLETNICSPIATNAIADNIWDNFSSDTYKHLPSVGAVTLHDPYTGEVRGSYTLPGGGRGFTRPASLVSLWSTAPFLQNNSVGPFDPSPSVEARMNVFDASIEQMLWPEKRTGHVKFSTNNGTILPGQVDVTPQPSYLRAAKGYLPGFAIWLINLVTGNHYATDAGLQIGPFPAGTPVNLISNIDLDDKPGFFADLWRKVELFGLILKLNGVLQKIDASTPPGKAQELFKSVVPDLIANSKCPDYIINRGHYFGTKAFSDPGGAPSAGLSDGQKRDLITFLKTL